MPIISISTIYVHRCVTDKCTPVSSTWNHNIIWKMLPRRNSVIINIGRQWQLLMINRFDHLLLLPPSLHHLPKSIVSVRQLRYVLLLLNNGFIWPRSWNMFDDARSRGLPNETTEDVSVHRIVFNWGLLIIFLFWRLK